MVCGSRGAVGIWFPLSGRAADNGVIGGSGWRAVVRRGIVYEREGYSSLILVSVGGGMVVRRALLDVVLCGRALERGLGGASRETSVVGGGGRSVLGTGSDIRERIRVLLAASQDGTELFRRDLTVPQLDRGTRMVRQGNNCGFRFDDDGSAQACLFRFPWSRNHHSRPK